MINISTDWTRECLERGETLSKLVLSSTDLKSGVSSVVITIPEHLKAAEANQPLNQGVLNQSTVDTKAQILVLLDKLYELEAKSGPHVLIVEDNLIYPSDKIKKFPNLARYLYRDRYFYARELAQLEDVNDFGYMLGQSSGYPLNAFVVPKSALPKRSSQNQDESDKHAKLLASSVIAIINEAYDGETYTLWIKNDY